MFKVIFYLSIYFYRKEVVIVLVDYHIHALGHMDREHTIENIIEYLEYAKERNIKEIGFADHDRYLPNLDFSLYQKVQALYPDVNIRVGLEVDYFPGKEQDLQKIVNSYDFDYLIGSVHYVDHWMFDASNQQENFKNWDIDELYQNYLNLISGAAQTGFFFITGHLDLLKIFGHRPKKSLRETFEPTLKLLKKSGVVVELNTNGWYKPVEELYPEPKLISLCFENNIPITLSSDAHQADQVGRDVHKAVEIAKNCGYKKIAVFNNKKVNYKDIG